SLAQPATWKAIAAASASRTNAPAIVTPRRSARAPTRHANRPLKPAPLKASLFESFGFLLKRPNYEYSVKIPIGLFARRDIPRSGCAGTTETHGADRNKPRHRKDEERRAPGLLGKREHRKQEADHKIRAAPPS